MPSVFISHSSHDRDFCVRLKADLENEGIVVWLDATDLLHGEALETTIRQAIEKRDFLLVVLSANSVESQWAHFEVGLASRPALEPGGLRVMPVVIEECHLPVYIQGSRFADFRRAEAYADTLKDLARSISLAHRRRVRQARTRAAKWLAAAVAALAVLAGGGWFIDEQRRLRNQLFTELSNRAWQLMDSHPNIAKALADDLVVKYPSNPEALRIRGWIYNRDDQFDEALKTFRRALELSPDPTTKKGVRLGIANSLMGIGSNRDLKEARVILEDLVQDRSHWNAHVNLATLTFVEGRYAQAAADFESAHKTVKASSAPGQAAPTLAYVMVGWALALAKSPNPPPDAAIVEKFAGALCHHGDVRAFLLEGRESIGFYGYGDFTGAWKEVRTRPGVANWLGKLAPPKPAVLECRST
jgi:cytochrome c-type biogenesis protein CcmH/NrfG